MPHFAQVLAPEPVDMSFVLRVEFELRKVFHDVQLPDSAATSRLLLAYLVIVDKAVREYAAGRQHLIRYASDGGSDWFVEGLGHFENCINSAKRALRLLERLGSQADVPRFDRVLRKLAQNYNQSITAVRDAIEHIDADIISPVGLLEGHPHLLSVEPNGENLRIGEHVLSLVQLHRTLNALFRAGTEMVHALPDGSTAN